MIPPRLRALFSTALRQRGDQYARLERATITRAGRAFIAVAVRGSSEYAVEINGAEGEVLLSCDCRYGRENGICKHVWAALVTVDNAGKLAPLLKLAGPTAEYLPLPIGDDDLVPGSGDDDEADDWDSTDEYDDDEEDEEDEEEEDEDEEIDEDSPARPARPRAAPRSPPPSPAPRAPKPHAPAPPRESEWRQFLRTGPARPAGWPPAVPLARHPEPIWPHDRRIGYVLDLAASVDSRSVFVELTTEKLDRQGRWGRANPLRAPLSTWLATPDPTDRRIIQMLAGAGDPWSYSSYGEAAQGLRTRFTLLAAAFPMVLPLICSTGRCRVQVTVGAAPLDVSAWDDGDPWRFTLRVSAAEKGDYALDGALIRDEVRRPFVPPMVAHGSGLVLDAGTLTRVAFGEAFPLAARIHARGSLPLPARELPGFLQALMALPSAPRVDLPTDASVSVSRAAPVPCLTIRTQIPRFGPTTHMLELGFAYGDVRVPASGPGSVVFAPESRTVHHRDPNAEAAARARLLAHGARDQWDHALGAMMLTVKNSHRFDHLIRDLVGDGWRVDAKGKVYRAFTGSRAEVRSGIDWFDLDAAARYGDAEVSLHALLEAESHGDIGVALPDGTLGLLPMEWLAEWKPIAAGGVAKGGATRFSRAQTALLDALLAVMPDVDVDATFEKARTELRKFERVAPVDAPASFTGVLREYQREGLGWLHFLRQFQLGGCLADDMGLGKTVQVLALLEARRTERKANGPSLVVVPRSLVYNWMREAERFAPGLRVVDHTLKERRAGPLAVDDADLLITTYGILRLDAPRYAEVEFDYCILDEAQAIKNASTASAKAARLIRARHRLAVTGTPIENRLEELWSIFEFLNPGMLGGQTGFGQLVKAARLSKVTMDDDAAPTTVPVGAPAATALMSRALRPVILRRTKQVVAKELPERSEQTLEVEMEPPQRKFYDALLARYRASVLERVVRLGLSRSRMHILEALLRLRQAACHPVLADPTRRTLPSAKLDALVPALAEVTAEGHKALVFSQFTSFLALVRTRLDAAAIPYEYLDGHTRDRQHRVDHFQQDAACPVFLISLKAGGQGLNLTAADYVYLLDPWWNPAVEAQAIDRTHRIGQTRRVLATRLVARGTIEEKILQLQSSKRALADAILSEDQGMLTGIGRDELTALLS